MPADDLTDPAPATTFAHLDATTVLNRALTELGIYFIGYYLGIFYGIFWYFFGIFLVFFWYFFGIFTLKYQYYIIF